MISIDLFSGLAPFVQLIAVIGIFAVILIVACNRTAAANLVAFIRELHSILRLHKYPEFNGNTQHLMPVHPVGKPSEKDQEGQPVERKQSFLS